MSSIRHPNILTFYGITITDERKCMIVEYLKNGSLDLVISKLREGKETMSFSRKVHLLMDVANGMSYLHGLRPKMIVHRDLKPGNILLTNEMSAKVCDFGLSKMIGDSINTTATTNLGTIYYMAPECFDSNISTFVDDLKHTKIDVYSFGVIMYELFFEESPYSFSKKVTYFDTVREDAPTPLALLPRVLFNNFRPKIPFSTREQEEIWVVKFVLPQEKHQSMKRLTDRVHTFVELMKKCWDRDANNRPTFVEVSEVLAGLVKTSKDFRDPKNW